jgi:glyoxylase-like metal-dependent hydrolase (beta-lactamase superfamily II)
MIERVETWVDNPMVGDMLVEAAYSNYKDFGGVKFPGNIVVKQGGYPTLELAVNDVKPNAPAEIQGNPIGAPPTPPATSQMLADGVYLILPAYAALAVDFKDYIVIVEGPQSDARAKAIIAEAKRVIPNKPIKYVVNTHNHFDHSSGLRPFVAEGATIITHQQNKAYFEKILAQPRTLNPDVPSAGKKPSIETMGDKKVLTDGNHVVELHRLQGSNHNDGLIVAYLPKEKILVEADAFNPPAQADAPTPATINANNTNLLDNIARLKLNVETLIPVHYPADSRKVTMAELLRAAGKS